MKLIINSKHFNDVSVKHCKIDLIDQVFFYISLYFCYIVFYYLYSYLIFEESKMTDTLQVS